MDRPNVAADRSFLDKKHVEVPVLIDKLLELLMTLLVAAAGQGLGVAAEHADPHAADRALEAVQAAHDNGPSVTGAERAAQAHADADAAKAAGQAKAAAARANAAGASAGSQGLGSKPSTVPPVSVPVASGPPASHPPFPVPPVDTPND